MTLIPAEILKLVSDAKTEIEKINLLRKYGTPILLQILKHTFEPRITFDVNMDFAWKVDDAPIGVNPSNLWQEFRKIKYFYNSISNITPPARRQKVLRDILESIHETDGEVLLGVLRKQLPFNIDADLVLMAFPGLWDVTHPANITEEKEQEIVKCIADEITSEIAKLDDDENPKNPDEDEVKTDVMVETKDDSEPIIIDATYKIPPVAQQGIIDDVSAMSSGSDIVLPVAKEVKDYAKETAKVKKEKKPKTAKVKKEKKPKIAKVKKTKKKTKKSK